MSCNYLSKFISGVNQACKKKSTYAVVEYNTLNIELSKLLFRNGLLTHYFFYDKLSKYKHKVIVLYFKFSDIHNSIRFIKQISKPGRRIYVSKQNVFHTFGKYNFSVLSTSMGFFTLNEVRQIGIGGELLMEIDC
jgi:small subunit ribosomal protein S8